MPQQASPLGRMNQLSELPSSVPSSASSPAPWNGMTAEVRYVSPSGGPSEALPIPEAGSGSFSPDGSRMVYSPRFRDFRPEKRYSGGQANKLYIYDMKTNDAQSSVGAASGSVLLPPDQIPHSISAPSRSARGVLLFRSPRTQQRLRRARIRSHAVW